MSLEVETSFRSEKSGRQLTAQELVNLIEAGRRSAEEFRHDEAVSSYRTAVESPLLNHEQRARVRCVLAESLEYLARYREALPIIEEYESPSARAGLASETLTQVWLRLGSLRGYVGDYPRAIAYLKSALAIAEERKDNQDLGAAHLILGRIYRAIGETQFARDHLRIALKYHRQAGHWIPLAQNYFQLGNAYVSEGEMEAARESFEQAVKIIGDRRAPLLLGSIYTSLSNLILLQEYGQAREGVETLEKAILYLEEAKNNRLLAYAYSNLGFVLKNIGEWARAHQVLQLSIDIGRSLDNKAVQGTALDTLGELSILTGDLDRAEKLVEEALTLLQAASFPYGEVQAVQTLGRCFLAKGQYEKAIAAFENQLTIADRLEDKRSRASAKLHLAEARAELKEFDSAQRLLDEVAAEIDATANVSLIGHFRTVSGRLRLGADELEEAKHEFGQAITIFSMVDDRFREAMVRLWLGRTYSRLLDYQRSRGELKKAQEICRRLGEIPLSQAVENEIQQLPETETIPKAVGETASQVMLLRLMRAAASRELLLNELVRLLSDLSGGGVTAVFEIRGGLVECLAIAAADRNRGEVLKNHLGSDLVNAGSDLGMAINPSSGEMLYRLRCEDEHLVVYLSPNARARKRRDNVEPVFRVVEMGLALNSRRAGAHPDTGADDEASGGSTAQDGFIFASPPMQALVSDIHKIRGSRVTALITGESGTGKEVLARLIHNLSDRRANPFVAFNCTIASPEIVNSQLFGHKKGSFTGAVSDTIGVIKSADGGTLFLDEIGDLALEVQPKLLRFLQEGEIHRLGETSPTRVDVRVIAATNADLEKLVAEGRFREDLYYRLNVIRLHIPTLRDRREEIPLLIEYYLRKFSEQSDKTGISIDPHTLDLMMVYDWPGNVRQLANEMQRLVAYKESGEVITDRDLSPRVFSSSRVAEMERRQIGTMVPQVRSDDFPVTLRFKPGETRLDEIVDDLESQIILDSMRRHQGRRNAVCEELGITRKGLYLKLRRLPGIDLSEF